MSLRLRWLLEVQRSELNATVVRCRTGGGALVLIILSRVFRRLLLKARELRQRRLLVGAAILVPVVALAYFGVSTLWPGASPSLASTTEMVVDGLEQNRSTGQILVVLKDKAGGRRLTMVIGEPEARTIFVELQGIRPEAPMTHDVMRDMLQRLGARVNYVLVNNVSGGTFSAKIFIASEGREIQVDSRPSDAIALALRTRSPIFVESSVLDRAGTG